MPAHFYPSIAGVDAQQWQALLKHPSNPFLDSRFLSLLEDSGSVGGDSGWVPCHFGYTQKHKLHAALPLYIKEHSWGEYVFDWQWAQAYQQYGLAYYPKLVTAVPFTPATGERIFRNNDIALRDIVEQVQHFAQTEGCSGWHVLFTEANLANQLEKHNMLIRHGIQYHWHNRGYGCFDEFLAILTSRKRKQIKRERREVEEQGLEIRCLQQADITPEHWGEFYRFYQQTYLKRSGSEGYLTEAFFQGINDLGDNHALVTAHYQGTWVAAALFFFDDCTLYGRYWGCSAEFQHLHFELCYYQGIELAIANQLQRFDAGAQGEHKLARGFQPTVTYSAHWLAHPGFHAAIGDFVQQERRLIARHVQACQQHLPYKNL